MILASGTAKAFRFFQGNALQAAGTYGLFLALAHTSKSPEVFGQFVVLVSLAGIFPVIIDALSSQQLVRMLSNKPDSKSNEMNTYLRARLILVGAGSVIALPVAIFALGKVEEIFSFSAMYLAASLSVVATTNLTFANEPKLFSRAQLIVFVFTALLALAIFFLSSNLDVTNLFYAWGLVKSVAALIFIGFIAKSGGIHPQARVQNLLSHILGKEGKKHFLSLGATHFLNATTAQVDTFIAASIGLAGAAKYQAAQRPVLALSVLNVSISQSEYAESIRPTEPQNRRHRYLPILAFLVWPLLALAFGGAIFIVTPLNLRVSFEVFAILGLANGFGLLASVSGPKLLVNNQTKGLLTSAAGQLAVLVATGLFLANTLGVLGVSIALALAKGSSAAIQAIWLRFYSAKP